MLFRSKKENRIDVDTQILTLLPGKYSTTTLLPGKYSTTTLLPGKYSTE